MPSVGNTLQATTPHGPLALVASSPPAPQRGFAGLRDLSEASRAELPRPTGYFSASRLQELMNEGNKFLAPWPGNSRVRSQAAPATVPTYYVSREAAQALVLFADGGIEMMAVYDWLTAPGWQLDMPDRTIETFCDALYMLHYHDVLARALRELPSSPITRAYYSCKMRKPYDWPEVASRPPKGAKTTLFFAATSQEASGSPPQLASERALAVYQKQWQTAAGRAEQCFYLTLLSPQQDMAELSTKPPAMDASNEVFDFTVRNSPHGQQIFASSEGAGTFLLQLSTGGDGREPRYFGQLQSSVWYRPPGERPHRKADWLLDVSHLPTCEPLT